MFSDFSRPLVESKNFSGTVNDLLKTNLGFIPPVYISIIFLSVFISLVVALIIFLFFLFFNLSATPPFIVPATNIISRFLELAILYLVSK